MAYAPTDTGSTSNNPWFVISVGLLCFIGGFGVASMNLLPGDGGLRPSNTVNAPVIPSAPTAAPAPTAKNVPPVTDEDHVRGNPNAKVTVIEYSDYECPFCSRHHPTMKQVMSQYGDDVNWVYRHFPLSNIHPKAIPAALASECVAELGGNDAFWAFTDEVFEKANFDYTAIAAQLKLNASAFATCFDGKKYEQKVSDQMAGGSAAGVSGTPGSIILNNKTDEARLISGAVPLAQFQAVIDPMLR